MTNDASYMFDKDVYRQMIRYLAQSRRPVQMKNGNLIHAQICWEEIIKAASTKVQIFTDFSNEAFFDDNIQETGTSLIDTINEIASTHDMDKEPFFEFIVDGRDTRFKDTRLYKDCIITHKSIVTYLLPEDTDLNSRATRVVQYDDELLKQRHFLITGNIIRDEQLHTTKDTDRGEVNATVYFNNEQYARALIALFDEMKASAQLINE